MALPSGDDEAGNVAASDTGVHAGQQVGQQPASEPATAGTEPRAAFYSRTFRSLRNRDYRLLWFGTTFSSSALWIQQTSVGWLTYQLTGSAFLLGLVNGFRAVPLLVLAPFGGVAADRLDRKKLMFVTQVFLLTVTAAFATVVLLDYARVWNIILFTLLTGVAWAFNMPVRQSIIPNLVPKEDLQNAIALNSAGMNLTRIAGPSVAGLMIGALSITGNFYLQAAMYVGVCAMVWQTTVPDKAKQANRGGILANLAEGARYVWKDKQLRWQMAVALLPVLLAAPYTALMPVFASDVLGVGGIGFGFLMAAPGIGALVGTLAIASADNMKRRGPLMFICLIGLGLSLAAFSRSHWYALSFATLTLVGAFQMVYMSTNRTLLQIHTPDEYRGRVMGIYMLNQGMTPLGALLAGTLAELRGAPYATLVMGSAVVVLAALAMATVKSLRDA